MGAFRRVLLGTVIPMALATTPFCAALAAPPSTDASRSDAATDKAKVLAATFDEGVLNRVLVSEAGQRRVLAGAYQVAVGGGQPGWDLPTASGQLTVDQLVEVQD